MRSALREVCRADGPIDLDREHEPRLVLQRAGEEVLHRLGALAPRTGRAHPGPHREERRLEVANRAAQVPGDGGHSADLEVGDLGGGRGERLETRVAQRGEGRHGADDHGGVPLDSVHAGPRQQQRAPPARVAAVGDLGHENRAAGEDRYPVAVAEPLGRLRPRFRYHHITVVTAQEPFPSVGPTS